MTIWQAVAQALASDSFTLILILDLLSAIAAGMIFQWKGRNPVGGFAIGLFLSYFGLLLVLIWPRRRVLD